MTPLEELRALHQVTQARYDQKQQKFRKLVAEETRLRQELARLGDMLHQSRREGDNLPEMRAIGADILWQGWIGRSRARLNLRLAQVLAVKEHHLSEVRQAFGKVMVVEELMSQELARQKAATARTALDRAIAQTLFPSS